jgi:hypothetical protein
MVLSQAQGQLYLLHYAASNGKDMEGSGCSLFYGKPTVSAFGWERLKKITKHGER